jgi:hypothetical protein
MPPERQRKLVSLNPEILRALAEFSRDSGVGFGDAFDEALRDYLKKKGQPVTLRDALKQSAKMIAANDRADKPKKRTRRK